MAFVHTLTNLYNMSLFYVRIMHACACAYTLFRFALVKLRH